MIDFAHLVKVILIFFRVIGVIVLCPIFGDRAFPAPAKIGLALFISLVLFPVIPVTLPELTHGFLSVLMLIVKEMLVGITIGSIILFMFMGVQLAGEVMGFQMGMWLADVFDPQFGVETPVISHFQYLFALMVFLAVNGHHLILKGLKQSFVFLPLGGFTMSEGLFQEIMKLGGDMFRVGFQIGAPVIGVLLLISLVGGLIARVEPEINILIVEIPLKIAVGLLFLALSLPYIGEVLVNIYSGLGKQLLCVIKLMGR